MSTRIIELLDKISPRFSGHKYPFPLPDSSYLERLQNRLAHFNQLNVYLRTCDATGKRILSMFSPAVSFPVYDNEFWWSDKWDPTEYGRDFDFSKTFFEQWKELRDQVPHLARSGSFNENCEYSNNVDHNKNGYLIFNTTTSEDCMYSENVSYCKDCIDCTQCKKSELCYECTLCTKCYNLRYSENSENCSNSFFLLNSKSCEDCFCCVNLYRKKYCIFNKQYTKEEYQSYINGLELSSYTQIKKLHQKFESWKNQFPRPHIISKQAQNSTGHVIHNLRDVENSFFVFGEAENLINCFNLEGPVKDCFEHSAFGIDCELVYQSVRCGLGCFNIAFCIHCIESVKNLIYCEGCRQSEDNFGCVGLRRKQYCILNKQYSKEDYECLIPRIIEHMKKTNEWGKFYPTSLSAIPYNHSLAQRYFPLSKEEALAKNFFWYEKEDVDSSQAIAAEALPDDLPLDDDKIIVKSAKSKRPFLILSREIKKYRELNVPLPRLSYDERIEERAKRLGALYLSTSQCKLSNKVLNTVYKEDAPFPVWSKEEFDKRHFT